MKKSICLPFCLIGVIFLICGNSTINNSKTFLWKGTTSTTDQLHFTESLFTQNNDLIGDWKVAFETYDENENKKLDPEERKKGFSNHFFYRFSADGTALVNFNNTAQGAFKAHYKISTRKNFKFLSVFLDDDKNENPDGLGGGYYIISVDKNELVLLAGGIVEHAFWVFKRS